MRHLSGPRVRRLAAALTAAVLALGVVACGDEEASPAKTTTAQAAEQTPAARALAPYLVRPERIDDYPPLPRDPPAGKTLYFLAASPSDLSTTISDGLTEATKVVGWQYKSLKYDRVDPAGANSAMISAVNAGADQIVVAAVAAQQIRSGLSEAQKKGVEVMVIAPNGPTEGVPGIAAQISATTDASAGIGGETLALGAVVDAERSDATAHIGIVTAPEYASVFKAVNDATETTVAKYCSKCTTQIIDVPLADVASGRAGKDIVSHLQQHPEVNYLIMNAGLFAPGTRPLLDSVGRDDVKIFGNVPAAAQLKDTMEGDSSGWLVVPQDYNAWLAVDAGLRAETGGDPTIHNNEPPVVWLVTQAARLEDTSRLPSFPLDYRERFTELWGRG